MGITRTLLLAAASISFALTPAQARNRQPDPELVRSVDRLFGEIDSNRDGQLSRDEGLAYVAGWKVSRASRERIWRRLDADRSGWVSKGELLVQATRYQDQMEVH